MKQQHNDHQRVEDFVKTSRSKRSIHNELSYRGRPNTDYGRRKRIFDMMHSMAGRIMNRRKRMMAPLESEYQRILKRDSRDTMDVERAYAKYYEKLSAKYRNYVKNLLGVPKNPSSGNNEGRRSHFSDDRPQNAYNNPETFTRYRATHKTRVNDGNMYEEGNEDSRIKPPIALPSINDPVRQNRFLQQNESMSNHFPSSVHFSETNSLPKHTFNTNLELPELAEQLRRQNLTAMIAQLNSQIVRKKRDTGDDPKNCKIFRIIFPTLNKIIDLFKLKNKWILNLVMGVMGIRKIGKIEVHVNLFPVKLTCKLTLSEHRKI